jgi:hypothetical protein
VQLHSVIGHIANPDGAVRESLQSPGFDMTSKMNDGDVRTETDIGGLKKNKIKKIK